MRCRTGKLMLFFVCWVCRIAAQSPVATRISVENGMPANTVYCLFQSRDGYLWAGSDAGLLRYDGLHWRTFIAKGQKGLAVTGLCQSVSGKIYGYNFAGQVLVCNGDNVQLLTRPARNVMNLAVNGRHLCICGENGVEIFDEQTGEIQPLTALNNSFGNGSIPGANNVQVDERGRIWCVTKDKVYCYDKGTVSAYKAVIQPGDEALLHVYHLKVLPDGVWLFSITRGSVYKLDGNVFRRYVNASFENVLAGRKVTNVEYADSVLWICTYSGVIRWEPATNRLNVWYDHLALTDVIHDREGNYWFSSLYNGLYRCADLSIIRWDPAGRQEGRTHVTHSTVLGDSSFFVTETGLLYGCVAGGNLFEIARDEIADVQFMHSDPVRDEVFFGSNGWIQTVRGGKTQPTRMAYASLNDAVSVGRGYYAAGAGGVAYFSDKQNANYIQTPVRTRSKEILYNETAKVLWIASNLGLYALDVSQNVTGTIRLHLLDTTNIVSLCAGAGQTVYALSSSGTIFRTDLSGRGTAITRLPPGLHARNIAAAGDHLFCATNKGLWCYTPAGQKTLLADDVFGIGSNDVQQVTIAGETIRLATGRGLVCLPLDFQWHRASPSFKVTGVAVAGVLHHLAGPRIPEAAYDEKIMICTQMVGFASGGDYFIQYRLAGDTLWNTVSAVDENFSLQGLPSGRNTVQVRLVDHFGHTAGKIIDVRVNVNPPFWQTGYFYAGCIVLLIGVTGGFFTYRIRRIRKKQTSELRRIRLENDLRHSRQTALAAQMNPHFIFNVLNSIKGYIYDNDRAQASRYLDSFSDLVRRVLEMSAFSLVKLEDEIALLHSYIELESMLLDGKFSCKIEVDETIDAQWTRIPSMLVQPFVENAFKHGLRHSKDDKELYLRFTMNEARNELQVEITDNGIGLAAAAEMKDKQGKTYASFSTSATENRIALLNDESKDNVVVRFSAGPGRKGTTVHLNIRIKETP